MNIKNSSFQHIDRAGSPVANISTLPLNSESSNTSAMMPGSSKTSPVTKCLVVKLKVRYDPTTTGGSRIDNKRTNFGVTTTPSSSTERTLQKGNHRYHPSQEIPATTLPNSVVSSSRITRAEADQRSLPPPGEDLTRIVEEAKIWKEIPQYLTTALIRLVDGEWMAPTACNKCQAKKSSQCNRNTPCKTCSKLGISCTDDGLMVELKARRKPRSIVGSESAPVSLGAATLIGSNKRKRGDGNRTISYTEIPVDADDKELDASNTTAKPSHRKRQKVEIAEEEFSPGVSLPPPATTNDAASSHKHLANDKRATRGSTTSKRQTKPKKGNQAMEENYDDDPQKGKPEPYGQPKVWGLKRQQLCETLPYFKAYESAAYTKDGILYSLLIDREVGDNDKFTDQIVITKCGGGKTQDENGTMVQTTIQSEESATIGAFLRAVEKQRPIVVIAGKGNSASPSRLRDHYSVLDWFFVTDVWAEKIGRAIFYKARLEKVNLGEVSWWAPIGTELCAPNFTSPKAEFHLCPTCEEPSKLIYKRGFTCLQTICKAYFKFDTDQGSLDYTESFLAERTQYLGETPGEISPKILTLNEGDFGCEDRYRKGIVCPKCRCCIRRINWLFWACENTPCDFRYQLSLRALPVILAMKQVPEFVQGLPIKKFFFHKDIRRSRNVIGLYEVDKYDLPGPGGGTCGTVSHFKSNGIINQQIDGPNDLFEQMQIASFNLKRNPARLPGNIKETLTSHWATNWGAPYKFGVSQESRGFDEAPEVILKALMRLKWAAEQNMTKENDLIESFNELLAVGYFESSSMGFHDDGEKELGPTVATFSLGGSAKMEFRPKARSSVGYFKGDDQTKGIGNQTKRIGNCKKLVMLSLNLQHGDILVMHGCEIQKEYEHAVTFEGKLRFALTSRYMDPDRMKEATDREHSLKAGTLPPGSERFIYDGDINARPLKRKNFIDPTANLNTAFDELRKAGDLSAEGEENFLLERLARCQAAKKKKNTAGTEAEGSFAQATWGESDM